MLCKYSPNVYQSLLDIESRAAIIDKKDISLLGNVIKKFQLEDVLGICVLHRHVDLSESEVLVEDSYDNKTVTTPSVLSQSSDILPCMWKFEAGGFYPLQFAKNNQEMQRIVTRLLKKSDFFQQFSELLIKLKGQDLYGLSILRYAVDSEETMRLETTNEDTRTMTVELVPKEENESILETLFRFDGDPQLGCVSTQVCNSGPSGHTRGYSHRRD
jgi:hypothetical protein